MTKIYHKIAAPSKRTRPWSYQVGGLGTDQLNTKLDTSARMKYLPADGNNPEFGYLCKLMSCYL